MTAGAPTGAPTGARTGALMARNPRIPWFRTMEPMERAGARRAP
jgi:hypothetical protein